MTNVWLYGDKNCHKSRLYQDLLRERGVSYSFRDVVNDPGADGELRTLFSDGQLKHPTFVIAGKTIRNPPIDELDRILARQGIYDPGVVHEPHANRFVRYMTPRDSFVSYSRNDKRITLTHIEIPVEKRGTGLGARLALEVFPLVRDMGLTADITCSFMRRVAASKPEWAQYFGLQTSLRTSNDNS